MTSTICICHVYYFCCIGVYIGVFGSHAFQLLPYWLEHLMRKPDPAHTLANEIRSIIDSVTGKWDPYCVHRVWEYKLLSTYYIDIPSYPLPCYHVGAGYPNVGAISQYEFGDNSRWPQLKELADAHAAKRLAHEAAVNAEKAAKKDFDEAETKNKQATKAKYDKLKAATKAAHQALKGGAFKLINDIIITYWNIILHMKVHLEGTKSLNRCRLCPSSNLAISFEAWTME